MKNATGNRQTFRRGSFGNKIVTCRSCGKRTHSNIGGVSSAEAARDRFRGPKVTAPAAADTRCTFTDPDTGARCGMERWHVTSHSCPPAPRRMVTAPAGHSLAVAALTPAPVAFVAHVALFNAEGRTAATTQFWSSQYEDDKDATVAAARRWAEVEITNGKRFNRPGYTAVVSVVNNRGGFSSFTIRDGGK